MNLKWFHVQVHPLKQNIFFKSQRIIEDKFHQKQKIYMFPDFFTEVPLLFEKHLKMPKMYLNQNKWLSCYKKIAVKPDDDLECSWQITLVKCYINTSVHKKINGFD